MSVCYFRLSLLLLFWLGTVPIAVAQPAPFPHPLLALLPDDFAVAIVMHDLRGNAARWEKAPWLKNLRDSPIGKVYLDSPEAKHLARVQSELQQNLGLNWPALRDDILGDTLILCYTPGPKNKPDEERGLFLLKTQKPQRLLEAVDKLNELQIKAGKLKLSSHQHNSETYQRRTEGGKAQFYIVKGSLLAVTSNEDVMKGFLDRHAKPASTNPWQKRFKHAGADAAFLSLCVNPRRLDEEIASGSKKDDPLPGYWKALDAIFVTADIKDDAQLRIVLQADTDKLPAWARGAFTHATPASSLWQRFPERSILTIASHTDFIGLGDALKMFVPAAEQKKLDPFKDLLAKIGPDWGVCVLPAKDAISLPSAMFALEFKSDDKAQPMDQSLIKTFDSFVNLAVQAYNLKNADAPLQVKSVMQEKVVVKYLVADKLFPTGVQPAWTSKDGFLVLATSTEAIANFRLRPAQAGNGNGVPMMRASAPELAMLLEQRREHILQSLPDKDAKKNLEDVISLLNLFDTLSLSHHGGNRQARWTIQLTPASKK